MNQHDIRTAQLIASAIAEIGAPANGPWSHATSRRPSTRGNVGDFELTCPCGYVSEPGPFETLGWVCPEDPREQARVAAAFARAGGQ